MLIASRLKILRSRIDEACSTAGRDPATVSLLAVSKLHSAALIKEAFQAGQILFAENYVQEAVDKMEELANLKLSWHFIGRIQSNKVKFLGGGRFLVIQSVDRASIASALHRLVPEGQTQDIFLQFNVAAESTKGGIIDELDLENLFTFVVDECPSLRVLGLMVMPPLDQPPRPHFAKARELLKRLRRSPRLGTHPMNQLSMGTSADFTEAILEGSTCVRIGTEIFGQRGEIL